MRTSRFEDLTGKIFTKITILSHSHTTKYGAVYWNCKCACGNEKIIRGTNLKSGVTKSCGCYQKQAVTTHGMTHTKTFKTWETMKQRCLNANAPDYPRYGGRGVDVCKRWQNSFKNFLNDMGERPPNKTLDRINVDSDYKPSNCRWATRSQQQRNKTTTPRFKHKGENLTVSEWAKRSGLTVKIIMWRVNAGWNFSKILNTPIRSKKSNS